MASMRFRSCTSIQRYHDSVKRLAVPTTPHSIPYAACPSCDLTRTCDRRASECRDQPRRATQFAPGQCFRVEICMRIASFAEPSQKPIPKYLSRLKYNQKCHVHK